MIVQFLLDVLELNSDVVQMELPQWKVQMIHVEAHHHVEYQNSDVVLIKKLSKKLTMILVAEFYHSNVVQMEEHQLHLKEMIVLKILALIQNLDVAHKMKKPTEDMKMMNVVTSVNSNVVKMEKPPRNSKLMIVLKLVLMVNSVVAQMVLLIEFQKMILVQKILVRQLLTVVAMMDILLNFLKLILVAELPITVVAQMELCLKNMKVMIVKKYLNVKHSHSDVVVMILLQRDLKPIPVVKLPDSVVVQMVKLLKLALKILVDSPMVVKPLDLDVVQMD
jgi:hypothetical protein